jgi:hypothetical protein
MGPTHPKKKILNINKKEKMFGNASEMMEGFCIVIPARMVTYIHFNRLYF